MYGFGFTEALLFEQISNSETVAWNWVWDSDVQ